MYCALVFGFSSISSNAKKQGKKSHLKLIFTEVTFNASWWISKMRHPFALLEQLESNELHRKKMSEKITEKASYSDSDWIGRGTYHTMLGNE